LSSRSDLYHYFLAHKKIFGAVFSVGNIQLSSLFSRDKDQ